jgi:ornithine cyclodeaminase/alanine dehydrogenase-like protein (mu-crystallin family)
MALLLTRDDLRPVFIDLNAWDRLIDAVLAAYAAAPTQPEGDARPMLRAAAGDGPPMAIVASTAAPHGIALRAGPDPAAEGAIRAPEVMLLFDRERHLQAIMAGDDFNLVRIAAPTIAAAKHLAPKNPQRVGVIGSGFEARAHLPLALKAFPGVRDVRVYSPNPEHREAYARDMQGRLGIPVSAAANGAEAVDDADLVLGVADAREPAFPADAVKPGALVAAIARVQIPGALVTSSRLIVAQMHLHALGSGRTHGAQGGPTADEWSVTTPAGELADVIHGRIPPREHEDQIVLYRLFGLPGTDAAILRWAYDWAVANGVGTDVSIGTRPA